MPASACVSTSSVWKTLVTASMLIKAVSSIAMSLSPTLPYGCGSVEPDSVVRVLRRHIRQDHLIPYLQPVHHFDVVHRTAPQRDRNALRLFVAGVQLEQRNLRAGLSNHRPAHVHHVGQLLQRDGSIHAQI